VTYDGKRAADIPVSRYAVRHLVAAEVCLVCGPQNEQNPILVPQIDGVLIARQASVTEPSKADKSSKGSAPHHFLFYFWVTNFRSNRGRNRIQNEDALNESMMGTKAKKQKVDIADKVRFFQVPQVHSFLTYALLPASDRLFRTTDCGDSS
jgi:hypothetical protein